MRVLPVAVVSTLVGAAIGVAAGYYVAKEKLGREFDERLDAELAAMEKHYRKTEKLGEFESPVTTLAAVRPDLVPAAEALTKYQGHFDESKAEVPTEVTKNIFSKPKLDVDWEIEKRDRTEEAPYVLEHDEYMHGELNYQQISLTYFAGDNVLIEENDDVIEETELDLLVGINNLQKFGLQSNDPNVVYIRNHVKEVDIEVVRHEGKYAVVVAGVVEE